MVNCQQGKIKIVHAKKLCYFILEDTINVEVTKNI